MIADNQNDNSKDIQQQLNYIKRKLNERAAISTLSNYASIAEKLSKGNVNIDIDTVNKVITFNNGSKKVWMNINEQTLNNIAACIFQNGTQIVGLINNNNIESAKGAPGNYTNYAISAQTFCNFLTDADSKYAEKEHTHLTTDISQAYEEEETNAEEETFTITKTRPLDDVLDSKSNVGHTHSINDVNNLQTTLDGKANLNASNTFNGSQTISGSIYVSDMSTFSGIQSDSTIIGTNVLANNETRLAAAETALTGKANSVHDHTSADITNWATATENFAKINAANTFTTSQTINGLLTVNNVIKLLTTNGDAFRIFNDSMTADSKIHIVIGKDGGTGNYAYLRFTWAGESSLNNALGIGFLGDGALYQFYRDRVAFDKPLTVNGDLTITGTIYSTNTIGEPVNILRPDDSPGNKWVRVGANRTNIKNYASYGFRYAGDGSNDNHAVIWCNEDIVKAYPNRVNITKPLTVTGTLTVPAITLNGTDLATRIAQTESTLSSIDTSNCFKLNAYNVVNYTGPGGRKTYNFIDLFSTNPIAGCHPLIRIGKDDSNYAEVYYQANSDSNTNTFIVSNGAKFEISNAGTTIYRPIRLAGNEQQMLFIRNAGDSNNVCNCYITVGKNDTAANSAQFGYVHAGDNDSANYSYIQMNGNWTKFYADRTMFAKPIYITTTGGRPIGAFNGAGDNYFWIGRDDNAYNRAVFGFRGSTSGSTNNYGLLWFNADILKFFYNRVEILKPLTVSGTITCTSLTQTSDQRLKENIEEMNDNIIDNVKVYSFNLKNDETNRKHYGVIAQELQEIAPELIYDDMSDEHYMSVNYTELIPHLINKCKQQDKKINELEAKITESQQMLDKIYQLLNVN